MNLSLDYDNTYTRDPKLWDNFITLCKQQGHVVYCVTMRYDVPAEADEVREALGNKVDNIYFTGRKAKMQFMLSKGIDISVWIDDTPYFIEKDAMS